MSRSLMTLRWPGRLLVLGGVLLLTAAVLWAVPTNDYIFLPNRAQPVAPYVTVPDEQKATRPGGIYFVDVLVRKATLLERALPFLQEGASFVPEEQVEPKGASDEDLRRQSNLEMVRSQPVATAVALRELGYTVTARPIGVLVLLVLRNGPASGKLQPQDVVVSVNGTRVLTPTDLRREIRRAKAGSTITATVRRGSKLRTVRLQPIEDARDPARRPVIGIVVEQAADIRLPVKVKIDLGDIGGPSAGLALALDVMDELGRDVDRGLRVAATGTISLAGAVGAVGGIKQKTIAARKADVDVFLVPAGDNALEAARHAGELKIVAVHSFRQALRDLATVTGTRS
jgi:Lon-like protease